MIFLVEFPINKLKVLDGILKSSDLSSGSYIEVPLVSFKLNDKNIDTKICIDNIHFSRNKLENLVGQKFSFTVDSTAKKCLDASIYINHAHHPIEISEILIQNQIEKSFVMEFSSVFILDFEGLTDNSGNQYKNFDWRFIVLVESFLR